MIEHPKRFWHLLTVHGVPPTGGDRFDFDVIFAKCLNRNFKFDIDQFTGEERVEWNFVVVGDVSTTSAQLSCSVTTECRLVPSSNGNPSRLAPGMYKFIEGSSVLP